MSFDHSRIARSEFEDEPLACLFCGGAEHVELCEIWGHDFQIDTCCEGLRDSIVCEMGADPDYAKRLMRGLDLEPIVGGHTLRRVADDGLHLLLDFKLDIRSIPQADAKAFVLDHHEHCNPPVGWRFGAGIWNANTLIGVVMVGRPVARALDHRRVVEANRVCVRRDTPAPLRWNACSQLYGWAARTAASRGFEKIITYTLETEEGTSLRAAGWTCEGPAGGGSWDRRRRRRTNSTLPSGTKTRWCRLLMPSRTTTPNPQAA